jgi:hypothetical protein
VNQGAELAIRTQSLNLNSSARYATLCSYAITASQFALGQSRKLATVAEDEGYVRLTADLKTPTKGLVTEGTGKPTFGDPASGRLTMIPDSYVIKYFVTLQQRLQR